MPTNSSGSDSSSNDTIVAIITPPGQGGIAAIRLAGPQSRTIASGRFRSRSQSLHDQEDKPFLMKYGHFMSSENNPIDEVMIVYMPHGNSYTGLEQVEIFCHGGRRLVECIMEELIHEGARPADPGEFTRLAFLSGRIDLARAEAVAELIAADTEQSLKAGQEHLIGAYSNHIEALRALLVGIMSELEASIDFSEEEISIAQSDALKTKLREILDSVTKLKESYVGGRIIKEGFKVAIAGRPNAGKSSLFNLLLKKERAIVSQSAGTTRDYLTEWIDLGGFAVSISDTAGLRDESGNVEKFGQELARKLIDDSDLTIWLFDSSEKNWLEKFQEDIRLLEKTKLLTVANKIDLLTNAIDRQSVNRDVVEISCRDNSGLDNLHDALLNKIRENLPDLTSGMVVTSARHQKKLVDASDSLKTAGLLLDHGESPEIVVFELKEAINALGEITGRIYTEEILGEIFSSFCIGK